MTEYDPKTTKYNPSSIEKKWQDYWQKTGIYHVEDFSKKPKYYSLVEFPYPSGDGLHVGHVRSYTAMDIISRKKRREGFSVLYPMGWDAFGLPTENFAIKTGKDPRKVTKENSDNFRRQLKSLGLSFDWSREVNTTDPKYYKWTQWLFLQFFNKDLAYKAKMPINWCPKDKIGLANEEVVDGCCERCGTQVVQKEKEQWMLAITKYADRLYDDIDALDYPERVKIQQKNWIGRSEGAEVEFERVGDKFEEGLSEVVKVFTTRPDTIFGATFIVVAGKEDKFTGRYVINPATKERIPIWEAEYVISDYGTGAIMAVPAEDERDRLFAEKHGLPIVEHYRKAGFENFGKKVTKYKLRDWVFSRQRYWGEPIPIIHCQKCGAVPVAEKDLPVLLPEVENYQPTDTGESPLANVIEWVNVKCPKCQGEAKRETDTMPNWAGSSWYFLAYLFNNEGFENLATIENWKLQIENYQHFMPVDWYNGGMEHTVLHLLYSRFWNKFLFDLGLVPTDEPYKKRTSHGLILAEDGEKMSKSRGNVVNPDNIVKQFGADTLRLYEMFMGPFEQAISWSEASLVGPRRFLEKVWRLQNRMPPLTHGQASGNSQVFASDSSKLQHQTIKKVSDDIEATKFNTAISSLMIYVNALEKQKKINAKEYETLLLLLAPFAPHITEELWHSLGHNDSIHTKEWPTYDKKQIKQDTVTMAVQIDGKPRASLTVPSEQSEEEIKAQTLSLPEVQKWLGSNKTPKKVIVVPGKVVSIVT